MQKNFQKLLLKCVFRTERDSLLIAVTEKNGHHMERYRNAADEIYLRSISAEQIKTAARKRWRRNQGWLTRNYIHKFAGKDSAFLYEKYLRSRNIIKQ